MTIEIKDGMDFHNFNLDCKPEEWFKRVKDKETIAEWLKRVSYKPTEDSLKKRPWNKSSCEISLHVLNFLRKNSINKEELEVLLGFELNLKGDHNWNLIELKKLEMYTNLDLCLIKSI